MAQPIRTGSAPGGYALDGIEIPARELRPGPAMPLVFDVTVHADGDNGPGAQLFSLGRVTVPDSESGVFRAAAPAGAVLQPDTLYWVRLSGVSGVGAVGETSGTAFEGAEGWVFGESRYLSSSPTGPWTESPTQTVALTVLGQAPLSRAVEPVGGDLPFGWHEGVDGPRGLPGVGVIPVGGVGLGRLAHERDSDWFRIDGLQRDRRYRIAVDFVGPDAIGGGINLYQGFADYSFNGRSRAHASNFDGNAHIEWLHNTPAKGEVYLAVTSDNKLNRALDRFANNPNRHVGLYTVTVTDITDVVKLFGNMTHRSYEQMAFRTTGHLVDEETLDGDNGLGHIREWAAVFSTGTSAGGYSVDSVKAFLHWNRVRPHILNENNERETQGFAGAAVPVAHPLRTATELQQRSPPRLVSRPRSETRHGPGSSLSVIGGRGEISRIPHRR